MSVTENFFLPIGATLDKETAPNIYAQAQRAFLRLPKGTTVVLDLSKVQYMDSAGAALCLAIKGLAEKQGLTIVFSGCSPEAKKALSLFRVRVEGPQEIKERATLFERIGEGALKAFSSSLDFCVLAADTLYYAFFHFYRRDRARHLEASAIVEQMVRIGLESLGIVALISLLVGLTVALQSAYQLRQFGANIYIANLVGVAMTREMGPLMTAILIAGRSGASISAEISTMVITEEVDALKVMGLNPTRFLVVPRFWALTLTQPLLTVISDTLGILGGFAIAVTYLQLGAQAFLDQLISALQIKDIVTGLVKSVSFAWIIVFVAAFRGFRVRGGAEGVGLATTASVVQSIFMVIAADAFFSLLFYFGD